MRRESRGGSLDKRRGAPDSVGGAAGSAARCGKGAGWAGELRRASITGGRATLRPGAANAFGGRGALERSLAGSAANLRSALLLAISEADCLGDLKPLRTGLCGRDGRSSLVKAGLTGNLRVGRDMVRTFRFDKRVVYPATHDGAWPTTQSLTDDRAVYTKYPKKTKLYDAIVDY